ncbi:MAG TPA: hypothetical protein VFL47_02520 [Flavisolibacter sp.]|nr:hypothetical protein [Flavisolibacter sp.]
MIHIKYKIWFALKLEIEGYSGDVFDVCDWVATPRCLQNLASARIVVKKQPNLLTHLIEVQADGPEADLPVYRPLDTLAFKYNLVPLGSRIFQLTNVNTLDPVHYQVNLSNAANNKIGPVLYVNQSGTAVSAADRVFAGTYDESGPGALAVMTVYQNQLLASDYRLQDDAGKCREPVYVIRFAKHN